MSACLHEGAPPSCPLCAIGEGFTEDGQASLDLLGSMIADACDYLTIPPLRYAWQCVLDREWKMARDRLHERNAGEYDSSGMLRSARERGAARTGKVPR